MSSPFDSSPRASKRRRTTKYGNEKTTLAGSTAPGTQPGDTTEVDVDDHDLVDEVTPVKDSRPKRKSTSTTTKSSSTNAVTVTIEDDPDTPSRSGRSRALSKLQQYGGSVEAGEQDQSDSGASTPQPRSSGRQRRAPRRLDETEPQPRSRPKQKAAKPHVRSVQEDAPGIHGTSASPLLRGILTPSKRQRKGTKKSVMFSHDEKELEEQLGFRDINTPAKALMITATRKSTPYPKRVVEEQADSDESDSGEDGEQVFQDAVEIIIPSPAPIDVTPGTLKTHQVLAQPDDDDHTHRIRSAVLARLTSRALPSRVPEHLLNQYDQIHTLLTATVASSESNSMLILGPRGAGKSMLLELSLTDLFKTHHKEFHVVRLSGFLQTDDRLALREIWRQLGHDRGLDDAETEDIGASYADTMSSLLSLLSHPEEMGMDAQQTSTSIVFILDEFDLFTTHPRQTLLYNLFDIAQSRKAPIAVVGCSTRMDVIECLEKRVKSRFSHRWTLVPGCKTMKEWEACVRSTLMADDAILGPVRAREAEAAMTNWNESVKAMLSFSEVHRLLNVHFYSSKSLPALFMDLFSHVAMLQPASLAVPKSLQPSEPPLLLNSLLTLPVLHLSLLAASCRLTTIYHIATPNFNLVHAHYSELVAVSRLKQVAGGAIIASGTLRQWNRELCRGVWEELANLGFLVPVTGATDEGLGRSTGGEGEEDTRMWRAEIDLDDMEWSIRRKFAIEGDGRGSGGAGEVLMKWCREI